MTDKEYRKPTEHNMKRRSHMHDYSHSGLYHITISTAKDLHQPLGQMAGRLDKPDGDSEAPHVVLSPLGQMVEQELTKSIQQYYPMLKVLDYVIMPEHIHFLLVAYRNVVSRSGRPTHLGQVIAGFKYGCNKRYWVMTGRGLLAITPVAEPNNNPAAEPPGTLREGPGCVLSGLAAKPAAAKSAAPPLFDSGYCDVMPIDEAQLEKQRAYIRNNPRNRLLRMSNRSWLLPQRMCVETHLSLRALRGYLLRECPPSQMTDEVWLRISELLLTPWKYHYRKADEGITVAECKTMNCITQAVCRLRDDWWT